MKYYTVEQTAKLCGVHTNTIRKWIKEKKLSIYQLGKKYHIKIAEIDIPAYLRKDQSGLE